MDGNMHRASSASARPAARPRRRERCCARVAAAELLDLGEDEELEKPPQSTQANLPSDPQAQQVMAAYAAKSMGGSGKEVQSAVDAAKQWKPSSDALSSAQLCLDLAFGCVSASGVDVECLSSLRQCRTETPWKSETESCCHAASDQRLGRFC